MRSEAVRVPEKERHVRVLAGFGTGVNYGVHANNVINLMRGITERVLYVVRDGRLGKPPQPKEGVFQRLSGLRRRLVKHMPPTPVVEVEDYPQLYHGRKRMIYQRAVDSLVSRGLTIADSFVSTFLKAEKINFTSKADPAPRVIQPRSARYNVMVGRYLKLFEKRAIGAFTRVFRYPVILKGINPSVINVYTGKIDYVHPLKNNAKFEAGIKASIVETDNNSLFNVLKNNNWEVDPRSNEFIYKENIYAAYVNGNKQWKNTGLCNIS